MSNKTERAVCTEDGVILDVQNLTVHYETDGDTVAAVNGISFQLKRGKILGMVGETGAGKTSTALAILNLIPSPPGVIKSGEIRVCGHDMRRAPQKELEQIRGRDISMIFQDPMTSLNPVFTVGEQIAESIRLHFDITPEEAMERALNMLEKVGIPRERATEYPHQFSGGMKQRVIIAIALACNPQIILADEPTTALDVTIQAQVLDLIYELKTEFQTGMLFITHDMGIIAEICDEVAVMYAGRIIEQGTLEEIFNHTKHPYTEGLFNSLPDIENRTAKLQPIPGLMPNPTQLPKGCAFAPRCAYAKPECMDTPQKIHSFSDTHKVMCMAYEDPEFSIRRGRNDCG